MPPEIAIFSAKFRFNRLPRAVRFQRLPRTVSEGERLRCENQEDCRDVPPTWEVGEANYQRSRFNPETRQLARDLVEAVAAARRGRRFLLPTSGLCLPENILVMNATQFPRERAVYRFSGRHNNTMGNPRDDYLRGARVERRGRGGGAAPGQEE